MKTIEFFSADSRRIYINAARTGMETGFIQLEDEHGQDKKQWALDFQGAWYFEADLRNEAHYCLRAKNALIHLVYLWNEETVLREGVRYVTEEGIYNASNMEAAYEQRLRNRYHFSPFSGWMNDPNGLCFDGERYHLFYQYNPAALRWGNAYWGHAVSSDMVTWMHMPIALFPQDALRGVPERKGGAYSGSANVETDGIHLYFTRHFSPWEKSPLTRETQQEALLNGGINVAWEKTIIDERPRTSLDFDFRDPKAVELDGKKCLLIGGTQDKLCCVFRYDLSGEHWRYAGLLFSVRERCDTFECPTLIKGQNGEAALLCSLQNAEDSWGRKRLSRAYIGRIEKGVFIAERNALYDFGTECYAVQTFEKDGRTLGFGWVLSAYDEFKAEGSVSNGCITIPRELRVENGRLLTMPARELDRLIVNERALEPHTEMRLPNADHCYRLSIYWDTTGEFRIILAQSKEKWVGLEWRNGEAQIFFGKKNDPSPVKLSQEIESIGNVVAYVDRTVVEVFINDGEFTATKTFFFEPEEAPTACFEATALPKSVSLGTVRHAWRTIG